MKTVTLSHDHRIVSLHLEGPESVELHWPWGYEISTLLSGDYVFYMPVMEGKKVRIVHTPLKVAK